MDYWLGLCNYNESSCQPECTLLLVESVGKSFFYSEYSELIHVYIGTTVDL